MTTRVWIASLGILAMHLAGTARAEAPTSPAEVAPAAKRWAADGPGGTPGFTRNIQPLLGKLGCSNRACHGSFQGAGGFRLSLFGSDAKMDVDGLKARIDVKDAGESLALLKATLQQSHKGGKRFEKDSWHYRVFKEWIAAGAPFEPAKEAVIERLEVTPGQQVFGKKGDRAQLTIRAHYSDKTIEDVTAQTLFTSNDDLVATVSESGLVTANQFGDTAIVATYGGAVSTAHMLVPLPGAAARKIDFPINNRIDEFAVAKWRKLGITPSDLTDDATFLRRVSLDLIGTLPTADEVRAFLADRDPQKRAKKIDELLNRPEYALFWATRFSDLTGNDDRFTPLPRSKTSWLWYDWLKDKLAKNVPYDELVAGVVTATTREGRSVEATIEEHRKVQEALDKGFDQGATYAQRQTCDIFWKKAGNRGDQVALQISYAFLGIRLECAQCHKHPFDRWTQNDFKGYTAFFTPVRVAVPPDVPKDKLPGGANGRQSFAYTEVAVQQTQGGKPATAGVKPRALGGSEYPMEAGKDPRVALMEWMRAADNPFFAKAIVNRIWAHYLGVGIIDPADDLNAANPPSNPELLDWLAKDFIEHKFDLKHLHRTILNSRVYQLTWQANETNALDRRNFSHAVLRRISAEVVVDAINQATGTQERYNANLAPAGTRAIGLAPTRLGTSGPAYALAIFGRPLRTQTCDCERSGDAGLPQAMFLINDVDVNGKIGAADGRLARLVKSIKDDDKLVEELFLSTVSRLPSADEKKRSLEYVSRAADRKAGFEDVLWSLINLREFIFNH